MKPVISPNCRIRSPEHFKVGNYSIIDDFCYFSTRVNIGKCSHIASGCSVAGGIHWLFSMGDYCSLSSGVKIWCTSDDFTNDIVTIIPVINGYDKPIKNNIITGDVIMENFTAVGSNSVIMPGNRIPEGTVVGALSFVPPRSELKPWSVYAGTPARFIKPRNKDNVLRQFEELEKNPALTKEVNLMIKWWQPQVGYEEQKLIQKVFDSNFVNEGELTNLFEQKLCGLLHCRHAVAVTSCTTALFLALKALGIGNNDEVIVPDITFIATANAVEMCGAKPVLADVNPETMTLDLYSFSKAITGRTKAVIPVHVSGRAADMESISMMVLDHNKYHKNNIHIVEDAAEAFLSKHKGKCLGTFGKAGCFSYSPHKTITTGQGGVIVTDDDAMYVRLKELKDQGRPVRGTGGDDIHSTIGYNFKFTDIQAAVGLGQLNYLEERIERMKRINSLYREYLKDIDDIVFFPFDKNGGECPQWTDVIINEKRDQLYKYLKNIGIECRKYWYPIHTQQPYRLPDDDFPNSTKLSPRAMWLPSAFTLSDDDIEIVCRNIRKFFNS